VLQVASVGVDLHLWRIQLAPKPFRTSARKSSGLFAEAPSTASCSILPHCEYLHRPGLSKQQPIIYGLQVFATAPNSEGLSRPTHMTGPWRFAGLPISRVGRHGVGVFLKLAGGNFLREKCGDAMVTMSNRNSLWCAHYHIDFCCASPFHDDNGGSNPLGTTPFSVSLRRTFSACAARDTGEQQNLTHLSDRHNQSP